MGIALYNVIKHGVFSLVVMWEMHVKARCSAYVLFLFSNFMLYIKYLVLGLQHTVILNLQCVARFDVTQNRNAKWRKDGDWAGEDRCHNEAPQSDCITQP